MLDGLDQQFRATGVYRWYMGREPQERPIILGLVLLVLGLLVWSVVWKPVSDWREMEANRYQNAQGLWDWVQANESEARSKAGQAASSGGNAQRALLPLITRAANAQGLKLNRLQPECDGAVSVVVQAQSFNKLLIWLDQLNSVHNITVQRIALDAEGQPGLVNAQMRLL